MYSLRLHRILYSMKYLDGGSSRGVTTCKKRPYQGMLQGDNQAIPLAQAGVVYYSEEMMAFIRDLQAAFGSPPRYLRQASKRSEDFWHKRTHKPAGGPKMSLGELFSYMNLNIRGVDCAFQHHAVSSGDLGEVHARPEDIKCAPPLISTSALVSCTAAAPNISPLAHVCWVWSTIVVPGM